MADKNKKINHVAIIMDGNGRWAKKKGLPHIEGHKQGAENVRTIIRTAGKLDIKYLTLYAFSTENWKRSPSEVTGLMSLLGTFLDDNINELNDEGIRLRTIGNIEKLPYPTRTKLKKAIKETEHNDDGHLFLALSYGGRAEIVDAAQKIAQDAINKKINPKKLDEKQFAQYLYAPDVPDPELMIRTSGEFRISNFMLWQLSYSEIYISDVLWPDFGEEEFKKAVNSFYKRERRFGGR